MALIRVSEQETCIGSFESRVVDAKKPVGAAEGHEPGVEGEEGKVVDPLAPGLQPRFDVGLFSVLKSLPRLVTVHVRSWTRLGRVQNLEYGGELEDGGDHDHLADVEPDVHGGEDGGVERHGGGGHVGQDQVRRYKECHLERVPLSNYV